MTEKQKIKLELEKERIRLPGLWQRERLSCLRITTFCI